MSWRKASGHENDHIDGRMGVHFIRLENTATGGVHELHIRLGVDFCPHCTRPFPKAESGVFDPKAIVADALEMLAANHQAVLDYAKTHSVPIRTALPNATVPDGLRLQKSGDAHVLVLDKKLPTS